MEKRTKIIIVIIVVIILLLFFVKLTGFVVRNVGTSINTCSDSDGGKEYWEKGNVYGTYTFLNSEDYYEEDFCEDEETLIEYYCVVENQVDSFMKSDKFKCASGCENGECLGDEVEVPLRNGFWDRVVGWFGR